MDESSSDPHIQKVLCTSANGTPVWVPIDKLEAWQKAQADQSPEAKARRQAMADKMMEALRQLASEHKSKENQQPQEEIPTESEPDYILPLDDSFEWNCVPGYVIDRKLDRLLREHPFSDKHIGKPNPFNGRSIQSDADYLEYLREYIIYQSYGKKLEQIKAETYEQCKTDILMAEAQSEHFRSSLDKEEAHHKKTRIICFALIGFIVALSVLAVILANRNGFRIGATSGFDLGYEKGYYDADIEHEDDYSSGYQQGLTDSKSKYYAEGRISGRESGYSSGYDAGISDACEYIKEKNLSLSDYTLFDLWMLRAEIARAKSFDPE